MAKKKVDMRCLELQGNSYRYVSKKNGVRVHRKLDTLDLGEARRMRKHFEETGRWDSMDAIIKEALELQQRKYVSGGDIRERAIEIGETTGRAEARAFSDVARGDMPIDVALDRWHTSRKGTGLKDRTKSDHKTATARLGKWLRAQGKGAYIQTVTADIAESYASHLEHEKVHPRTANKHLNSLRSLWRQQKVNPNPWAGVSLEEATAEAVKERPFTDNEVKALLSGTSKDATMLTVIKVGLLTGARLDEVFQLRACDIADGVAQIVNSKRKGAITRRPVPLHDDIRATIEAMADALRKAGKPDEYLFEGDATGWDGARSMAFSKRFATYRRKCKVDDVVEGQRRSKVNFHSCRRWLVTKLEHAECPLVICQRIIGHTTGSLAGDTYSGGGSVKLMAREIAKVRLP